MALATIDDLAMLGSVNPDQPDFPTRGDRLLDNVTGQVCSFLQMTEAAILTALTADEEIDLAGFVAEVAARRLQAPASPTTDPMAGIPLPWQTSRLTERDKAWLLSIPSIAEIKNPDAPSTGGVGTIRLVASEYIGGPFDGDSLEDSWT